MITLAVIVLLLYISFRRFADVAIILGTLPLAAVGGVWLLYVLGYDLSVAVGVGFIALAGVAVEIGVVMLVYLNQAVERRRERAAAEGRPLVRQDIEDAVIDGAVLRIRPVIMTVAATIAVAQAAEPTVPEPVAQGEKSTFPEVPFTVTNDATGLCLAGKAPAAGERAAGHRITGVSRRRLVRAGRAGGLERRRDPGIMRPVSDWRIRS